MDSELVAKSGKPRLLIVDDEEGLRMSLRAVFYLNFELHLCRNSAEAMAALAANRISVAILDIKMEGESGLDLLREIKSADPLVEVIMLTAYETLDALKSAVRSQACDFLSKPFDLDIITASVARALRLRMASEVASVAISKMRHDENGSVSFEDGVIHDVRNVMTGALALTEFCNDLISTSETLDYEQVTELRRNFDALTKNVALSCDLCSRYLNALRMKNSPTQARNLYPILADLCDLLRSHPDAKSAQVRLQSENASEIRTEIDPVEVFQMVFNVALNGIQSTGRQQTVTIEARTHPDPLASNLLRDTATTKVVRSPTFRNEPPFLAIRITDEGGGIDPAILAQLFTAARTTKATGTGVGMSVVARLVIKNDALLFLETSLGKGTTTTIYFPISG